jgi:hypothetical protein
MAPQYSERAREVYRADAVFGSNAGFHMANRVRMRKHGIHGWIRVVFVVPVESIAKIG